MLDARLASRMGSRGSSSIFDLQVRRERLAARLAESGRGGELLASLALGDRTRLDPTDREAFRRLGISHLLAVSGLHVGLVVGLVYALTSWSARRCPAVASRWDARLAALAVAALAGLVYGALTGWGAPVQRALVLVLAGVAVLASRRRRSSLHALALAALVIGVGRPEAFFDLGTQLSFAATGALLASGLRGGQAGSGRGGLRAGVLRALAGSLRLSATAIAATAPLLAWNGLASTPVGLLANVLAVPATAALLLPISLLAVATAALDTRWAPCVLALLAPPAGLALDLARQLATGLPATALALPPHPVFTAVAASLAVWVARARSTTLKVALCCAVCLVLRVAPPAGVRPEPPRVIVFDVGLGDAILVEGRAAAVLVDGGWAMPGGADLGRSVVVPGLLALGVERLDIVVASHADADHRGGLPAVIDALEVGEVWIPRGAAGDFAELLAAAGRHGVPVSERAAAPVAVRRGDLGIRVLWPPAEAEPGYSRNDRSLVLRIDVATSSILLTGDIGRVAEAALTTRGVDLRADVLKVPHHGSRGSSSREFLAAVRPELALLSAPCSHRGRLPTPEALRRLAEVGASVWWTGRDGALMGSLRSDFPTRTWWAWRPNPACRPP
jgi:competence protein ComEC